MIQRLLLVCLFGFLLCLPFTGFAQETPSPAATPTRSLGYTDESYSASGLLNTTGEKPERKLWWNNCAWWGTMFNQQARAYHIYRLDWDEQRWQDTGIAIDERNATHADTLWDDEGGKLYILSHIAAATPHSARPGNEGRLYRYSYDARRDTYSLDSGFPVNVMSVEPRVMTLAQERSGRLWVTYVANNEVQVQYTTTDDRTWSAPARLPVEGTRVGTNDISAVIAFDSKIGVAWTNHRTGAIHFAVHDTDAPTDSWSEEIVVSGGRIVDDHLNLTADSQGRVYLATKTSNNRGDDPFILINVRDNDAWETYVFAHQRDAHTRPVVVVDEENQELYVFATSPQAGGTIYYKTTPLDNIAFEDGKGTPILHFPNAMLNNVTTTKQTVNGVTELVFLASAENTARYYHNFLTLETSLSDEEIAAICPTRDADSEGVIFYVSSRNTVNVRSAPNTSAEIVTTLQPGSEVEYLGEVEGSFTQGSRRWARIEINGEPAYIHSSLLSQSR